MNNDMQEMVDKIKNNTLKNDYTNKKLEHLFNLATVDPEKYIVFYFYFGCDIYNSYHDYFEVAMIGYENVYKSVEEVTKIAKKRLSDVLSNLTWCLKKYYPQLLYLVKEHNLRV